MLSLLIVALHLAAFNFHTSHAQAIQGSPERQIDGESRALPPHHPLPSPSLACPHTPPFPPPVQLLLMLRNSIENWPQFAAANRISGWEPSVPVCLWTGVSCTDTGDITSV